MAAIFEYLLDSQISRQWRGVLAALAAEFEAQIGHAELRELMHRVGSRFAEAHALPRCDSTSALADALNALWRDTDWGFVELSDERDHLSIVHYCAPLPASAKARSHGRPRSSKARISSGSPGSARKGSPSGRPANSATTPPSNSGSRAPRSEPSVAVLMTAATTQRHRPP